MCALTDGHAFAYTWHDGTPSARTFGRGFVFRGTITPGPPPIRAVFPYRRLEAASRGRLPVSIWGRPTAPLLTGAFRRLEAMKRERVEMPLFEAMFPFARRGEYFLLFGRRGLAEYQALVPHGGIDAFLKDLEREVVRLRPPMVMLSMKLFRGSQRFLGFEGDGVCLTADLVRSPDGLGFLTVLDRLTTTAGGPPAASPTSSRTRGCPWPWFAGAIPNTNAFARTCAPTTPSGTFAQSCQKGWNCDRVAVGGLRMAGPRSGRGAGGGRPGPRPRLVGRARRRGCGLGSCQRPRYAGRSPFWGPVGPAVRRSPWFLFKRLKV